jgi:hypothetical protein
MDELGVPRTLQILLSYSISDEPEKSGTSMYNSAIMQPSAKISTGEL